MPLVDAIPARVQHDTVGGIVKVIYDFKDVGGAVSSIPLELELPAGTIIHRGFLDVSRAFTGTPETTTVGLSFIGSGTQVILSATAIASVTGVVALTANTTPVKIVSTNATKTARLNLVVAGAAVTDGRANIYIQYFGV